jgi:hypothetical protein
VTYESQPRPPARGPELSDDAPMGAPPGSDPDYTLHGEIGEEAKRLVTHPGDETRRLGEELSKGESEATPLLAISVVGIGVAVVIAVVVALVVLAIYLS